VVNGKPSLVRQVGIGCFAAWIGGLSGAMVAVLVAKVVAYAVRARACPGIPTCDWYIYAAVGGLIGGVTLPWLIVSALRRPAPPADAPDDSKSA
jgi:hypothetical protein